MQFKEWLNVQEINKGLVRNFRSQHPHLPDYVAKQALHNRIAPLWKRLSSGLASTMPSSKDDIAAQVQSDVQPSASYKTNASNPSSIYSNKSVQNIAQHKNWKEKVVRVSPLDFTKETIDAFLSHEFGSSQPLSKTVINHDERMLKQRDLADQRGQGRNEPIVMVVKNGKYQMQEGWHRLYAYFLQYSAPPQEREKIQSGRANEVDLTQWKPIQIKAWIGI